MNSGEGHQKAPKTIVGQLLDARSENEEATVRSTKVIVDENGNKVVQVRKRKRVYAEEDKQEAKKTNFKSIFLGLALLIIVLLLAFGGVFIYRVTTFNSSEFQSEKEKELSALWGAQVKLQGIKVEGFSFKVGSLIAEFPETSMIKSVEVQSVSGDLRPQTFVTGRIQSVQIFAHAVNVILRDKVNEMKMPLANGDDLWKFERFVTDNFNLSFEDPEAGPFNLEKCELYGKTSDDVHVLQLKGKLTIKGWSPIEIKSPMIYVSKLGFEQININGAMANGGAVSISGNIMNGQPVYGRKLGLKAANVLLSDLTKKAFTQLFEGEIGDMRDGGDYEAKLYFSLPTREMQLPEFRGTAKALNNVNVQKFPMLKELGALLTSGLYSDPIIEKASLLMISDGNSITVKNIDFEAPKVLKITGELTAVEAGGPLKGVLNFGVPTRSVLVPIKGKGDQMDPLFKRNDGGMAWVTVSLMGTTGDPKDNAEELMKAAVIARNKNSDHTQDFLKSIRETELNQPSQPNQLPGEQRAFPGSDSSNRGGMPPSGGYGDGQRGQGGNPSGSSSVGFDEFIR